jgi:hypothetical protein
LKNIIFHEITKLDTNKSSGTDNIGPRILKIIIIPLTYIFNRIIETGIYPKILKNVRVTPVYKTGEIFKYRLKETILQWVHST